MKKNKKSTYLINTKRNLFSSIRFDAFLFLFIALLIVFGIFILYSASGKNLVLVSKQIISYGVGLFVMLAIAQVNLRFMSRWVFLLYIVGLILLILVFFLGDHAMGATRWINIPGIIRFQPSELMKLIMPMVVAYYISNYNLPPDLKTCVIAIGIILIPVVLILKQPDLGTAILVMSSGLFVIFLAGLNLRWIILAITIVIPIIIAMWFFVLHNYQKQRVLTFLNPEKDPLGSGWNIIQSKAAIGSGGIFGKGWLEGTQSHLDFLPESHTDFIIAVLAEEFGMIGVVLLLFLYSLIILRGLYITCKTPILFGKLLAGSITMTFFVYVFVNIGMVSGLLPVVGVPLPLISYGGTSIVTLMLGFGILMSVSSQKGLIK